MHYVCKYQVRIDTMYTAVKWLQPNLGIYVSILWTFKDLVLFPEFEWL